MNLHESGEMYLKTIYILTNDSNNVRAIDISKYMNYSKPSVSRALSNLKNSLYVSISENGVISLTQQGYKIAKKIYDRHEVLTNFLIHIGVDNNIAFDEACRIEHVISDDTYLALKKHVSKLK